MTREEDFERRRQEVRERQNASPDGQVCKLALGAEYWEIESSARLVCGWAAKYQLHEIVPELERAMKLHDWRGLDVVHQAAVVAEEGGEVLKAALQYYHEDKPALRIKEELIQTAAMSIRMLNQLEEIF